MKIFKIFMFIKNSIESFISIMELKSILYNRDCYVNVNTFKIRGRVNFVIHKSSNIYIGKNFRINNSFYNNPIGRQFNSLIVAKKDAILIIGNNVGISSSSIVCNLGITIGNNTLIGGDVCIYDSDFHSLDPTKRNTSEDKEFTVCKPVSIGDNVFIGAHSIILKGVHIGNNSIIGAGSVVAKNIPENQVWGGNPAAFIKYLKHD